MKYIQVPGYDMSGKETTFKIEVPDKDFEKLTYKELVERIHKHNALTQPKSQYGDSNPLLCVIVFKNESWPKRKSDYPLEARSYEFRSDEKRFISGLGGNSIFAHTLDGKEHGVRLDWYIGDWEIDYCYIKGGTR